METRERPRPHSAPLYEQIADRIAYLVEQGTFRPGDRVPSLRSLSRQMNVSLNTVKEAYRHLEDRRVLEARPQSGYYVRARLPEVPRDPEISAGDLHPTQVSLGDLVERVVRDIANPDLIQLGASIPDPRLLPVDRLSRMLAAQVRRHGARSVSYALPPGWEPLRQQISQRMLAAGCALRPDEIVVTNGCMEAVNLALRAICRPGDTLALESPTYYNFLQIAQALDLRVLEIPSTAREGISLEALAYALEHTRIHACLVVSNFGNPQGGLLPEERQRELVELLARHGVPLIEDDINGDLSFSDRRPPVAKAYDRSGTVVLCSSFSKTLAPGYRVGWIAAGRFQGRVERLKLLTSMASPTPPQMAVAEFLANGGYDRHLRAVRRAYRKRVAQLGAAIGRHFPSGTRVTRPEGGYTLWVEMPEGTDALALYGRALAHGITLAPGPVFSASGKFANWVRLNAAFWSERAELAVATLGRLVGESRP
ncbi:MAG: PLP-dependent aminotransferase family protein [Deferrisomatales bacterium]